MDECTLGLTTCGLNTNCENTMGSYICYCRDGYEEAAEGDAGVRMAGCIGKFQAEMYW